MPQNPIRKSTSRLVSSPRVMKSAPVAQRIEHRPPEPGAQVRVLPGAQIQRLWPSGEHVAQIAATVTTGFVYKGRLSL